MKAGRTAREAGVFGDLPWLDFRKYDLPGVQVVDSHTLRIRVKGQVPAVQVLAGDDVLRADAVGG
jgi:hypothetical protein